MTENLFSKSQQIFDENYKTIKEKIALAAKKSGRKSEDITLLAATKTVPVEIINHAIRSGISCIGENRVQEFQEKYDRLDSYCDKHFIGQLQTNKVKYLIGKVSCIESVDSLKLVKEISRLSAQMDVTTNILIEVNIGREANKGGIMPENLLDFVDEARQYPHITVNGLMAIPPICEDSNDLTPFFSQMNQYYVDIRDKKLDNVCMQHLSMGMSGDFELAIEQGATIVRIGSLLFGGRK
ncbi:YggS family pyridoxal phosphate-dependent enzyme [Scatolibacter rhodanostii]|uniref:YggS family pyridoxal phosphate-dependent enzyme n=1 Tax=Scatolibacter rhodanostii TaxID=2014781 RepID=UPI000C071B75|nr:YggS family pyridoxal phosphate-dependent enzyme [Scatolibacter rhodanostii]